MATSGFYDLTALDQTKKQVNFSDYKGKVVLIVNVASYCGYTKQYAGLQTLYKNLNAKGVEVLGFPCNQFGAQEPGSNEEIADFCTKNFGVTFKLFDKVEVNGNNVSPVYKYLKDQKGVNSISWNFEKFLVDKQGNVVGHYKSGVAPEKLQEEIEKLL